MREVKQENVNLLRSFVQGVGYPGGIILALNGTCLDRTSFRDFIFLGSFSFTPPKTRSLF